MNSDVGPIFNEKIVEKWNLWGPWTVHGALFTVELSTIVGWTKKKKKAKRTTIKCGLGISWIQTAPKCLFHVFVFHIFFFFLRRAFMLFQWVLCTDRRTYKPIFSTKLLLKMGLMALFTYLKIILLQCFQFLTLSDIQTHPKSAKRSPRVHKN